MCYYVTMSSNYYAFVFMITLSFKVVCLFLKKSSFFMSTIYDF